MNVPPMILDLRVASPSRRPLHLWLPLFLLWPLVFALGVVALVLTIVVDVFLVVAGQRYHHYTALLLRSFEALTETRGMLVSIKDKENIVHITFV